MNAFSVTLHSLLLHVMCYNALEYFDAHDTKYVAITSFSIRTNSKQLSNREHSVIIFKIFEILIQILRESNILICVAGNSLYKLLRERIQFTVFFFAFVLDGNTTKTKKKYYIRILYSPKLNKYYNILLVCKCSLYYLKIFIYLGNDNEYDKK